MANPNEIASKWARRLGASTEDIKKGVDAVTEAPSQRAVRKKEKFVAELMRAIQDGTWERALQAYGLEQWKADMKNKGINRIASGAEASKGKMEEFLAQFLPYVEEISKKVDQMPDNTLEDRINRAIFAIREQSKFRKK